MPYFYIPTDILEEVAQQVDRPRDLLSLALSSTRLRDIVVPRHIQFREISCDPHRISLWKSLEQNPRLAENFRSLELYAEASDSYQVPVQRRLVFPRSLVGVSDDIQNTMTRGTEASVESLRALKQAVAHMKRLRRFTWKGKLDRSVDYSVGWLTRKRDVMLLLRDLFDAIVESCPLLKEVDVSLIDDLFSSRDAGVVSLGKLSGLDRFSFTIYHSVHAHLCRFHTLNLITKRCSDLVDLKLKVTCGVLHNIADLFTQGHWPHLRRLTLDGLNNGTSSVSCSQTDERALLTALFLERHPQLEQLSLMSQGILYGHCIFEGTLTRLRSFRHDNRERYIGALRLVIPSSILERLEYFSPREIYGEYPVEPSRTSMRAFASRISDDHLPLVVKMFPNLERLHFLGPHSDNYEREDTRIRPIGEKDVRTESLLKLKRLTHLAGFLFCTRRSPVTPESLEFKIRELSTLPSLRYVNYEIWSIIGRRQAEIKWICIDREECGQYIGYRYIEPLPDMDPKYWGRFFENLSS